MFTKFDAIRSRLHELREENIKTIAREFSLSEDKAREWVMWCTIADDLDNPDRCPIKIAPQNGGRKTE